MSADGENLKQFIGLLYDPPSGWQYGFPKKYQPKDDETLEDTLRRDGYSERLLADGMAQYCRFIGIDESAPAESKAEGELTEDELCAMLPTYCKVCGHDACDCAEPPQPSVQPDEYLRHECKRFGFAQGEYRCFDCWEPSVQGEQDWMEKAAKRIDREFIDDAWKWKEIATIIRIFAPTAPSITNERIAEIAEEVAHSSDPGAPLKAIEKVLSEAGVRVG